MKNKALLLLMTCSLIFILTLPAMAAEPEVSLEKAIEAAREAFPVPDEFNQFSSGFNNYEDNSSWNLQWQSTPRDKGSMNVTVDADSGLVRSMNLWYGSAGEQPIMGLPLLTREQGQDIAGKLIAAVRPDLTAELLPADSPEELLPLGQNWGPKTYRYFFPRQSAGIKVLGEGISVTVDADTGQVYSFDVSWSRDTLPDATKAISSQKAKETFIDKKLLPLQYIRPIDNNGQLGKVILVYMLDEHRRTIDAITGEPVRETGYYFPDEMKQADMAQGRAQALTPEEREEVDTAQKLISQDQAMAALGKWLEISDEAKLVRSNLERLWNDPAKRQWSFEWQQGSKEQPEYISGQINALTGEVLGFYSQRNSIEQPKEILSEAAAKEKALEFLKQIQPEKIQQIQEMPTPDMKVPDQPLQYYTFSYTRLVNEIPYYSNNIRVTVDAATGAVKEYSMNWDYIDFPAPEQLIRPEQAANVFLEYSPLELVYRKSYSYDRETKWELIYRPEATATVDALSGALLGPNGQALNEPKPITFTDIDDHWAKDDIALLGQAGLFSEYGSSFKPDQGITLVELVHSLLAIKNGIWSVQNLNDEELIEHAVQNGLLTAAGTPGKLVSREELAAVLIRFLGYDGAARAKNVFTLPHKDQAQIDPDLFGHVALTYGLDLMGRGDDFRPKDTSSRAEAATAIIRSLKIRR